MRTEDDHETSAVDERAIVAQTVAYCWAIDFGQFAALDDIFLPEATAMLGSTACANRADIHTKISTTLGPLDGSQHLVANHEVNVDGDRATSRCYFNAQHVRRGLPDGELFVVAGRYEDRWVRTIDGWRIEHRDLISMWRQGNPGVIVVTPA